MKSELLLVKNMVCDRCIKTLEAILHHSGIKFQNVTLGEIHLDGNITKDQHALLSSELAKSGFELIGNHTTAQVEKIKQLVLKKARNEVDEKELKTKLSSFLSTHLHYEYSYLSNFFSSVEGRTIENYFIEQRIEKVKELLVYNELTLSQIAFEMDYSSVGHLSNQFKKITGLTPSHFKKIGSLKRKLLDKV